MTWYGGLRPAFIPVGDPVLDTGSLPLDGLGGIDRGAWMDSPDRAGHAWRPYWGGADDDEHGLGQIDPGGGGLDPGDDQAEPPEDEWGGPPEWWRPDCMTWGLAGAAVGGFLFSKHRLAGAAGGLFVGALLCGQRPAERR